MQNVWNWLKARVAEPSTWLGVGAVVTAIGTAYQGGNVNWQTVLATVVGAFAAVKADPGSSS
jgi:hypothetical protein